MSASKKKTVWKRGRGSFSPTPLLASSISAITHSFYRSLGFQESRLVLEWEQIVGSHIASLTIPCKVSGKAYGKGDVLTLWVSSAMAPEITHCSQQIIEKINSYFGVEYIKRLLLKHHSMRGMAHKNKTEASDHLTPPLTGESLPQKYPLIEPLLNQIEDERLRAALLSLREIYSCLRRKKDNLLGKVKGLH